MSALSELKAYPNWVGYHIVKRQKENGDVVDVKMPMSPHTYRAASSTNARDWGTVTQAWEAKTRKRWTGVGWVFALSLGIVGVDLDKCIIDGKIQSGAMDVVKAANSYAEISPSGNGIHIFVKGIVPKALKTSKVEVYSTERYFTVTGWRIKDTPDSINEAQGFLDEVYERFAPKQKPLPTPRCSNFDSFDAQQIQHMLTFLPVYFDNYLDWVRVCASVHSAFPNFTGISLIEGWSPGYEGEVEKMFRSFSGSGGNVTRKATIGTLVKMALDNGWKPKSKFSIGDSVFAANVEKSGIIEGKQYREGVQYYKVRNAWFAENLLT